jgi:hypothetical protein
LPAILLSDGTEIQSEDVEKAEYYPDNAFADFGCHFGGSEMRACPFLFLQLKNGCVRIDGEMSAGDAKRLEDAGLQVNRFRRAV